jgi:tetratricopeptide (TPR) repeat protein/two-component sensor histidine kinase
MRQRFVREFVPMFLLLFAANVYARQSAPSELEELFADASSVLCQDVEKTDSLAARLLGLAQQAKEISYQARAYKLMGDNASCQQQFQKAIQGHRRAVALFEQAGDDEFVIRSLVNLSNSYLKLSKTDSALAALNQAELINRRLKSDFMAAQIYLVKASYYSDFSKNDSVVFYSLKALSLAEKIPDESMINRAVITLGAAYYQNEDYQLAIRYFRKSREQLLSQANQANLSIVNYNMANSYTALNMFDSASYYYQQALESPGVEGNKFLQAYFYEGLAEMQGRMGLFNESIANHLKAIELCIEVGEKRNLSAAYVNLSEVYLKTGQTAEAIRYARLGADVSQEIEFIEKESDAWWMLSNAYRASGRYKEGLEALHKFYKLDSTMLNQTKALQISDLNIKYETEKKENEIDRLAQMAEIQALQLSQQRYLIIGGAIVLLLVIAILVLYYRQRADRQAQALTQLEQKALRSQLNPHFIFNALGAIQNYMLQNKPQDAASFMSRFARLMRQILENSREDFITLDEEVATLENYLELQLLRFNNSFEYELTVDEAIDAEEVSIPPMFAQPLIENALEHGLKGKIDGAKVKITFRQEGEYVLLTVEDNGKGIASEVKAKEGHKSLAGVITNERIELFNAGLKSKIRLIVEDLTGVGSSGTRVQLMLPYREG